MTYGIVTEIPTDTFFVLGTVPSGGIPKIAITTNITVGGSSLLLFCTIGKDGNITVYNYSGFTIPVGTTLCLNTRYLIESAS